MKDGSNLHSYWDGRFGNDNSDRFLEELVQTFHLQMQGVVRVDMNPEHWVNEGFALRQRVHAFSGAGAAQDDPAVLSDEYSVQARKIALQRATFAGYRLSEFLNTHKLSERAEPREPQPDPCSTLLTVLSS
jgi:hypothetical protein